METKTTTYSIPNISCHHCVHTIKTELSDLAGVKEIDASIDTKLVKVTYESPATTDVIESTLKEINYPAVAKS